MDNTDHIIRPTKPVSHNLARTILEQGRYVPQVRMFARSKQSCSPANPNYSGSLVIIPWTILDTIIALRSRLICAMPTDCGHHRSLEHDSTRIFIKTLYPTSRRFSLPPLPPNYKENFTNDRDLGILSSRSSFCNESKFDA